ncbi:hypothetical protein FRB99_006605 [Tulasnella sp. 403]|nr:hypothetical protein FRB99_006605 [Tulasnella sp. 403]
MCNQSKVQPKADVTPLNTAPGISAGEWWMQPRSTPAVPRHLRVPSHSKSDYFAFFGSPVGKENENPDRYEEAIDDQPDTFGPSSPAALFLSGFNSPNESVRSNSLSFSPARRPRVDPPQDEIVGGYRLGPVIGHGAFSTVKRATSVPSDPTAPVTMAAVKIVLKHDSRPGASEARLLLNIEAETWSMLSHEHILPLFKTVDTPEATYLFMLYCPAGSLLDVINSHKADGLDGVGMDDAGMLFRQIVRGLRYLHEVVRLVHCDIKLDNILVDDQGSCRIADFGLARWMSDSTDKVGSNQPHAPQARHTIQTEATVLAPYQVNRTRGRHARVPSRLSCSYPEPENAHDIKSQKREFPPGSLPYAAPELLGPNASACTPPNPAQDIWALGCVLYALLFGKLPFNDPFEPRLQMKILGGMWKFPPNYRITAPGRRGRNRSHSGSRSQSRVNGSRRDRSGSRSRLRSPAKHSASFVANASPMSTRFRSKSRGRSHSNHVSPHGPLKTIGRVAENVLHGCLCINVEDRWTVSMVDEVGWGVGWDLDVDEAGEEFEEPGDMTVSASASSNASESGASSSMEDDRTRDRFGNRLYIPPFTSAASANNNLFSDTLNLVTSPIDIRPGMPDINTIIGMSKFEKPTAELAVSPTSDDGSPLEGGDKSSDKRSRSRGKRGKHSRSSSRAAVTGVSILTSPTSISQSNSPSAESIDPFHAFREGYVPSSLIPLLQTSSRSSSRAVSRAPSAVQSRAASRERDANRDWPRGRPTNNAVASWRPSVPLQATVPTSISCPLPIANPERTFEMNSWRRVKDCDSASPSHSSPPVTPIDGNSSSRSISQGRLETQFVLADASPQALVPRALTMQESRKTFGVGHSQQPSFGASFGETVMRDIEADKTKTEGTGQVHITGGGD